MDVCPGRQETAREVEILMAPMTGSLAPTPKTRTVVSLEPPDHRACRRQAPSPCRFPSPAPPHSVGREHRRQGSIGQRSARQSAATRI